MDILFDGSDKYDVEKFLIKAELHSSLKGHNDLKAAQFIASRLEGRAFDVYMRMSDADRKDQTKIKAELLKEFQRGKQNREVAIHELSTRTLMPGETPLTYAYKLIELVKLAYPSFDDATRLTIAKDFYVKGVHPDMQVSLKSLATFADYTINDLARETTRLNLAGIKCQPLFQADTAAINQVTENDTKALVDEIAGKVIDQIKSMTVDDQIGQISNRSNSQSRRGRYSNNTGRSNYNRGKPRCWSCGSQNHLVSDCPNRFCQTCGAKGHDSWSQSCPKRR